MDPDLKYLQSLLYLMRKAFRPFENLGPEGLAHSVLSMIGWQDILRRTILLCKREETHSVAF